MKKRADSIARGNSREHGTGKEISRRPSPTHDEIAQLAFSLYESRGREEGHHLGDWLRAEQELVRRQA